MDERFWRLPGPASWLLDGVEQLTKGVIVLDIPFSRRQGLAEAFEVAARAAGFASNGFHAIGGEELSLPPAAAIVEAAIDPDNRTGDTSPAMLANSLDMDGVVIWVDLDTANWRRWSIFVGSFLLARSSTKLMDPPAIVVVVPPSAEALDKKAPVFKFEGRIGRDDGSLVFAEKSRQRSKSTIDRLLAQELAVELAGWDIALIRDLALVRLEDLLTPLAWARKVRTTANVKYGKPEAGWQDGWVDHFNGRNLPSFDSLVAAGAHKEIELRIWRAQIRGLFPWLEEIRQEVIDRYRGKFKLPLHTYDNEVIRDPEDLDWGQVWFSLKGAIPKDEHQDLDVMRKIRNRLAHREPASFAELVEAEKISKRYLGRP